MNVSTDCVLVNEMLQDERDELYKRLVLLRKRTGMSVREFAEFAGIPENTYRTYEAKNPRYRNHRESRMPYGLCHRSFGVQAHDGRKASGN